MAVGAEPGALHLSGHRLVNAAGEPVTLKGCNLGGWLLLEPWMLGIRDKRIRDQWDIVTTLNDRFGADRAEELLDAFRHNWIGPREIALAKSFGFNLLRVPFHHELLATEDEPRTLRGDAFEWLDRAVELAEQASMYVILDMHGAPGGQSIDMPTGRVNQNKLWTDVACRERMAWLWQRIAERYRDRNAVVAYDLINEPWGDFRTDVRPYLLKIVGELHESIRAVDNDTLVLAPGALQGIRFYGDPRERGWRNVGFTEHFYPGLFGQGAPTLETHARFLGLTVASRQVWIEKVNVPYLLGEFNVVFEAAAQPEMMRRYYDACAENGWLTTMWSLRIIDTRGGIAADNWYLITNEEPFSLPDLHSASFDELERAFTALGTQKLVADTDLRTALTDRVAPPLVLAKHAPVTRGAQLTNRNAAWQSADVGDAHPTGAIRSDENNLVVFGGGNDIWGKRDAFHFAHRPTASQFSARSWLTEFRAPYHLAKAGWMLRESVAADAAHILIHAFPDGRVMLAWRSERGAATQERTLAISGPPVGLGIERREAGIVVHYTNSAGEWFSEPVPEIAALRTDGLVGLACSSHDELALSAATFQNKRPSDDRLPDAIAGSNNLLANASFEDAASDVAVARGWHRWGARLNRVVDDRSSRTGNCALAYDAGKHASRDNVGVWQDLHDIQPGEQLTLGVFAHRDSATEDSPGGGAIELRIESPGDDRVLAVTAQKFNARDIATGDDWSLLQVSGTSPSSQLRVLIIAHPGAAGAREATLEFDDAFLRVASEQQLLVSTIRQPRLCTGGEK